MTGLVRSDAFTAVEKLDQLLGLGRRNQLALVAVHVFLVDEPVDDVGSRRRGAEAALFHRLGQLFVVDQLAGGFHGGEQSRFRVTRRRLGRFREQVRLQRSSPGRDPRASAPASALPSFESSSTAVFP